MTKLKVSKELVASSCRKPLTAAMAAKLSGPISEEMDDCPQRLLPRGRNCLCMELVTAPYHVHQIRTNYRAIVKKFNRRRVCEFLGSMIVCGPRGRAGQVMYKVPSCFDSEPYLPAASRVFYICRPQFLALFGLTSTRLSAITQNVKKKARDGLEEEPLSYWSEQGETLTQQDYFVSGGYEYPATYYNVKSI